MIITKDFLHKYEICASACRVALEQDILGMEAADAVIKLREIGEHVHADDLAQLMASEKYIRDDGEILPVSRYKLFDPTSGSYLDFATEAEARAALIVACDNFIKSHGPRVTNEILNSKGDSIWIPSNITAIIS